MTDLPKPDEFDPAMADNMDFWSKIVALAEMIEIDQAAGTLSIRNGKSNVVLRSDGLVRVSGTRIVQSAERDIALDAAFIDLN
ncbi:hypothetical protein L0F51_19615 [Afifella sp. H1R]|uniref:hypothetical protein n=1 Tax=Afifella sp. H1R TaxID=2908841 RepID=UPI001F44C747|nr:hypothetical protein [Afifella sp. H1R]MCF1505972.1 hypothetical protein [Afifella sp. H1R]